MLAEAVIGEEDVLSCQVGEHGVGPVEHGSFDEDQLACAQVQPVPGLDVDEVPVLVVVAADDFLALLGAVDGGVGDFPHQGRQGAAVVDFVVVHDDVVNGREVDFLLEVAYELFVKGLPDCIYEGGFFVPYQVRIVRRTLAGGELMSVELCEFPVNFAYPGDFIGNLACHIHSS